MRLEPEAGETLDAIFRGKVRILQRRRGYRFAVDALLLASFVRVRPGERLLDIGAGSGVVALALWATKKFREAVCVEVQRTLANLAHRNIVLNGAERKISVAECDVRCYEPPAPFDVAVSNPPYRPLGGGRTAPEPERAAARHELMLSMDELFQSAARLLRPGGRFFLVHLPGRRGDMDAAAHRHGLRLRREREVRSQAGQTPAFLLRHYDKPPSQPPRPASLRREKPLALFARKGVYTPEAEALLEGRGRFTRGKG